MALGALVQGSLAHEAEPVNEVNWRDRWTAAAGRAAPHIGDPLAATDQLNRRIPGHVGVPRYLHTIALWDPDRVRLVPSVAVTEEGDDDVGEFALVACPCGAHPIVRPRLVRCVGDDCERWYTYMNGGKVFVVYGEMAPPPRPPVVPIVERSLDDIR